MIKFIKTWLRVLYIKWVRGECHHICAWCSYRNECWDNLE